MLGRCNQVSLMNTVEAVIEQDWTRSHSRSMYGTPGASDCIHQLFNLQPWECDTVTLPLSSHGELPGGGQFCREGCRKLMLHSGVNW